MSNTGKTRLVVLFGGQSAEHDVSCVSARHVVAAANPDEYDVVPVGITREGQWVETAPVLEAAESLKAIGTGFDLLPAVSTAADAGQQIVVLPVLHGPLGEDGTVQGLLELAGVPYVGCGVLGSALAMDKAAAKEMLAHHHIPQAKYLSFQAHQWSPDQAQKLFDELAHRRSGRAVFVKPANMGSSIGVSKATSPDEIVAAVELALTYDEWIVVEEAIVGREIECAVLGNLDPKVSVPGEVRPGDDFYSYADKYHDGVADLIIPADLPAETVVEMQELAARAFLALRCEGLARADFFYEDPVDGGRGLLLNELNTMPGFTPISMYPKLWAASGLSYPALIDALVELALERHDRKRRRTDY